MRESINPYERCYRRFNRLSSCIGAAIALTVAVSIPFETAHAARASKPKEIVVVGSKVKDVVRDAGFGAEGNIIAALGETILKNLADAMERAECNGRYTVEPFDLTCHAKFDRDDASISSVAPDADPRGGRMTKPDLIERLLKDRGFEAADGVLEAVEICARRTLWQGLHRARSNNRQTVRPHDL